MPELYFLPALRPSNSSFLRWEGELAWKRTGKQRSSPVWWNSRTVCLLNSDSELWSQLCYLCNIVSAGVERVLVALGMDRCTMLLSRSPTGRRRTASDAKLFEEAHKGGEFDFIISKRETWQRSGLKISRIGGPLVAAQFPLNIRESHLKEPERLAMPQCSLHVAARTHRSASNGYVAASTTLDAPSMPCDITAPRWNWYPGEPRPGRDRERCFLSSAGSST